MAINDPKTTNEIQKAVNNVAKTENQTTNKNNSRKPKAEDLTSQIEVLAKKGDIPEMVKLLNAYKNSSNFPSVVYTLLLELKHQTMKTTLKESSNL